MRECPRCESCYEDDVAVCPLDEANTKHTLPGPTLLSARYLLEKRLGRGAMGQVYLARDQNLVTRKVAIKTVRPDILSDESLQDGDRGSDMTDNIEIIGQAIEGLIELIDKLPEIDDPTDDIDMAVTL